MLPVCTHDCRFNLSEWRSSKIKCRATDHDITQQKAILIRFYHFYQTQGQSVYTKSDANLSNENTGGKVNFQLRTKNKNCVYNHIIPEVTAFLLARPVPPAPTARPVVSSWSFPTPIRPENRNLQPFFTVPALFEVFSPACFLTGSLHRHDRKHQSLQPDNACQHKYPPQALAEHQHHMLSHPSFRQLHQLSHPLPNQSPYQQSGIPCLRRLHIHIPYKGFI